MESVEVHSFDDENSDASNFYPIGGDTQPGLESDSDNGEDDVGISFEGEDDVPHPRNTVDLQSWLQLSDQHLMSLSTSVAPPR